MLDMKLSFYIGLKTSPQGTFAQATAHDLANLIASPESLRDVYLMIQAVL
jgi:hypothetical protein